MNEKISFPDLVSLLTSKMGVTKKEAEAFLKEFFTISTEVISSGEELKINGLGLFKPIWVESRSSVNVQTGEPVEIPGHYKLSFVPDKILREAVNAPFSSFSVEILNDHVSTDEMMAVGNDAHEEQENIPCEELPSDVSHSEAEAIVNPAADTVETGQEQPDVAPDTDKAVSEQTDAEPVVNETTTPEPQPEPVENTPDDSTDDENEIYFQKSTSRRAFWWGVLASLGAVVLVCMIGYFIWSGKGSDSANILKIGEYTLSLSRQSAVGQEVNKSSEPVVLSEQNDTATVMPTAGAETLVAEQASDVAASQPEAVKPVPTVEPVEETIRSGVFLTTLALKHFGHKAFWVYIYEENKGTIKNPNQIPIGTRLTIPDAAKYGIDANNKTSVDRAKALAAQIQSRYE